MAHEDADLWASVHCERDERVGPQHRWLGTSDRLCIRIWWVDTPEHQHRTQASDCAGTPLPPPLAAPGLPARQTDAPQLQMVAGLTEGAVSVAAKPRSLSQPSKLFGCQPWRCHLRGASKAALSLPEAPPTTKILRSSWVQMTRGEQSRQQK